MTNIEIELMYVIELLFIVFIVFISCKHKTEAIEIISHNSNSPKVIPVNVIAIKNSAVIKRFIGIISLQTAVFCFGNQLRFHKILLLKNLAKMF